MNQIQLSSVIGKNRSALNFSTGSTFNIWNPYDKNGNILLSNGNLTTTWNGGVGNARGNIGKNSGKWYWEIKVISGTYDIWMGIANASQSLSTAPGEPNSNGWAIAIDGGDYHSSATTQGIASGVWPAVTNDVFGFALDMNARTMDVYRNNTVLTPSPLFTAIIAGTVYPVIYLQTNANVTTANFGATTMAFPPPSGYNAGLYV